MAPDPAVVKILLLTPEGVLCFAPKGTSGSPLFFVDEATGETWIVAVNSRGNEDLTVATRLRGAVWEFVEREVRSDP